jgi:ribosomal protein S11
MKKTYLWILAGAALSLLILGCASQGPVVATPPTVQVRGLKSLSFTPDLVKFEAKILIRNNMSVALDFDRVDWAVDLFDNELFAESSGLKRTDGNDNQTVAFSFQIAMDDIAKQVVDVVSEESVRVTFRGEVYPAGTFGFAAIPFTNTITIPIPRVPDVTLLGVQGVPFSDSFAMSFRIRNTNSFTFSVDTVQTFLEINKKKYSLLHTAQATEMQPGESGTVTLRMENTPGKTLGMALNLAQSQDKKFALTGTIRCGTPYGWFIFPIRLEGNLN